MNARRNDRKRMQQVSQAAARPAEAEKLQPRPGGWQKLALAATALLLTAWMVILVLLARK